LEPGEEGNRKKYPTNENKVMDKKIRTVMTQRRSVEKKIIRGWAIIFGRVLPFN
jgi:hypothetical protein